MLPEIPGLRYLPDYLDSATHTEILDAVDSSPWHTMVDRRVQIYGYSYHDSRGGIYRIGELPNWAQPVAVRLWRDGLSPAAPDQIVVNDYPPGSGISRHIDASAFDDTIISLSLGSTCVMQFFEEGSERLVEWLLEPRSALVLTGDARYRWHHGIPARTADVWLGREWPRARRVSVTFRTMRVTSGTPPA